MEINGKTAIITGATGGLASQIVLALSKSGVNCICIYHKNTAKARIIKRKLGKKGFFVQADLTKPQDIEKIFTEIKGFSVPQILINAAAIFDKKPLGDINSEYIRQTFDINFTSSILMTQKFVEFVRKKVRQDQKPIAKIINFADITAQKPPAGFSVYSASKSALAAATKSLAKELAPDFTVNAVAPGIIYWPKNFPESKKKKILAHIPAGRGGRPDEVASAVKFLIENDYITGQVINIDGGRAL